MAATFTSAVATVLGDQRAWIGTIHMTDGPEAVDFGFQTVLGVSLCGCTAATGGVNVIRNHTSGNVYIGSCASGDSFQIMVLGK